MSTLFTIHFLDGIQFPQGYRKTTRQSDEIPDTHLIDLWSMKDRVDLGATKEDEYQRNCAVIKQKHLERKYNEDDLNKQMEKVDLIEWKVLLQDNEKSNSKKNIPLVLTYNRMLPNISQVVKENWHILQINPEFRNVLL